MYIYICISADNFHVKPVMGVFSAATVVILMHKQK